MHYFVKVIWYMINSDFYAVRVSINTVLTPLSQPFTLWTANMWYTHMQEDPCHVVKCSPQGWIIHTLGHNPLLYSMDCKYVINSHTLGYNSNPLPLQLLALMDCSYSIHSSVLTLLHHVVKCSPQSWIIHWVITAPPLPLHTNFSH